jgi:hypothetical protein
MALVGAPSPGLRFVPCLPGHPLTAAKCSLHRYVIPAAARANRSPCLLRSCPDPARHVTLQTMRPMTTVHAHSVAVLTANALPPETAAVFICAHANQRASSPRAAHTWD